MNREYYVSSRYIILHEVTSHKVACNIVESVCYLLNHYFINLYFIIFQYNWY